MVTQNSESGTQRPHYPWARNVGTSGMDFRYCEQDDGTTCNTHNSEDTYWFAVEQSAGSSSGTVMSPEIDFDWVSGQDTWGEASFSTTETNGDVKLRVYYTVSTACDTIVPDGVLSGNSSGFDVSASPVDISGLIPVASTYNQICLQATLTDSGGTPFLNDWTVSWATDAEPVYSVSITSSGVIEYGFVGLSTASSTVGNGYTQTSQNDGNTIEKLNIKSSDASGGTTWTLASAIGSNIFKHEFSTTTGSRWDAMPDSATYVTAAPSVAVSGTVSFDFQLTTPSASADYQQKSITITVQAVAP